MQRKLVTMLALLAALWMSGNVSVCRADDDAATYFIRGVFRYENGDFAGAIADLSKAIEIDPKHARAYYNRSVLHRAKGNNDRALADQKKAIEIDPKLATTAR